MAWSNISVPLRSGAQITSIRPNDADTAEAIYLAVGTNTKYTLPPQDGPAYLAATHPLLKQAGLTATAYGNGSLAFGGGGGGGPTRPSSGFLYPRGQG